jgi:hypothetical protein
MKRKLLRVVSICGLAGLALSASATIVVPNYNFESQSAGVAADWITSGANVSDVSGNGVSGYGETFGPGGGNKIDEDITLPAGAGTYAVTFWAMDLVTTVGKIATETGGFKVTLDGSGATSQAIVGGITTGAYTEYTVDLTTTGGGSKPLTFEYQADGVGGQGLLDDISVTAITAVPEPTTLIAGLSLLLPFGASTLRILRRRQSA